MLNVIGATCWSRSDESTPSALWEFRGTLSCSLTRRDEDIFSWSFESEISTWALVVNKGHRSHCKHFEPLFFPLWFWNAIRNATHCDLWMCSENYRNVSKESYDETEICVINTSWSRQSPKITTMWSDGWPFLTFCIDPRVLGREIFALWSHFGQPSMINMSRAATSLLLWYLEVVTRLYDCYVDLGIKIVCSNKHTWINPTFLGHFRHNCYCM